MRSRSIVLMALVAGLFSACADAELTAPETPAPPIVIANPSAVPTMSAAAFADADHGWAVGAHRQIWHTANGGRTWGKLAELDQPVEALHFLPNGDGWAITEQQLLATTDGGSTWGPMPLPTEGEPRAVQFLSPDTGWVSVSGPAYTQESLYLTRNGGKTWAPVSVPARDPSRVKLRFHFHSVNKGWLITGEYLGGGRTAKALYRTEDGGATWVQISQVTHPLPPERPPADALPLAGHLAGLQFVDDRHGFLRTGLEIPSLFATADGGKTWSHVNIPGNPRVLGAHFTSPTAGGVLVADQHHRASAWLETTDGGATWQRNFPTLQPAGDSLVLVTDRVGYAGGHLTDPGAVMKTEDGGQTWTSRQLPGIVGEPGVSGEGLMWLRTAGHLYLSTDHGLTWEQVY